MSYYDGRPLWTDKLTPEEVKQMLDAEEKRLNEKIQAVSFEVVNENPD